MAIGSIWILCIRCCFGRYNSVLYTSHVTGWPWNQSLYRQDSWRRRTTNQGTIYDTHGDGLSDAKPCKPSLYAKSHSVISQAFSHHTTHRLLMCTCIGLVCFLSQFLLGMLKVENFFLDTRNFFPGLDENSRPRDDDVIPVTRNYRWGLCTAATAGLWCALYSFEQRTYKERETSIRDVKWTSKFIFKFRILTFNIRVKFALEQMWELKHLRTRRNVFVLCRWLTPAASPADCCGLWRHCWCLITPPAPLHTSSVAVCLPDAFDLTATTSLSLR